MILLKLIESYMINSNSTAFTARHIMGKQRKRNRMIDYGKKY